MKLPLVSAHRVAAWLLPWLAVAAVPARAAERHADAVPLLVGPVVLEGDGVVQAAAYRVSFSPDGERAGVELTFQLSNTSETLLGFAGHQVGGLSATIDGAAARPEYTLVPLPVAGGPFDTQLLVRVPPSAGAPCTVVLLARSEARYERRDPGLGYPEATFILNQSLDGPEAWVVRFDPAAAATAPLTMRVETPVPFRPEAPIGGTPAQDGDVVAVEGPVVADPSAPLEVAAIRGEYQPARRWAFALGPGLVLDWPHVERTREDDDGNVVERWYATPGFADPSPRFWLSLLFQYAWEHWLLSTGFEGHPGGLLEIPLTFTWFPQERSTAYGIPTFDYRFLFGVALQVFNDAAPVDYALDLRPFVRIGAGIRFHVLQALMFYEVAPPVGSWNGPRGLVEHKLGFAFPFAF